MPSIAKAAAPAYCGRTAEAWDALIAQNSTRSYVTMVKVAVWIYQGQIAPSNKQVEPRGAQCAPRCKERHKSYILETPLPSPHVRMFVWFVTKGSWAVQMLHRSTCSVSTFFLNVETSVTSKRKYKTHTERKHCSDWASTEFTSHDTFNPFVIESIQLWPGQICGCSTCRHLYQH